MTLEQNNIFQEERMVVTSNRVVRRVPLLWQHPIGDNGQYIPLSDSALFSEEDLYTEGKDMELCVTGEQFMPDFTEVPDNEMGICAYEEVSEGTPISPVFPDTPEGRIALGKYCAQNTRILNRPVTADIIFSKGITLIDVKGLRF